MWSCKRIKTSRPVTIAVQRVPRYAKDNEHMEVRVPKSETLEYGIYPWQTDCRFKAPRSCEEHIGKWLKIKYPLAEIIDWNTINSRSLVDFTVNGQAFEVKKVSFEKKMPWETEYHFSIKTSRLQLQKVIHTNGWYVFIKDSGEIFMASVETIRSAWNKNSAAYERRPI